MIKKLLLTIILFWQSASYSKDVYSELVFDFKKVFRNEIESDHFNYHLKFRSNIFAYKDRGIRSSKPFNFDAQIEASKVTHKLNLKMNIKIQKESLFWGKGNAIEECSMHAFVQMDRVLQIERNTCRVAYVDLLKFATLKVLHPLYFPDKDIENYGGPVYMAIPTEISIPISVEKTSLGLENMQWTVLKILKNKNDEMAELQLNGNVIQNVNEIMTIFGHGLYSFKSGMFESVTINYVNKQNFKYPLDQNKISNFELEIKRL